MSLKYFGRYQFNGTDPAEEDFGLRDLATESGTLQTQIDGTYGTVLYLDGSTSLLSTGDLVNISGDIDRTFSFWARNDTSGIENPVLSYGDLSPSSAFVVYTDNSNSKPQFYDYTTTYESVITSVVSTWSLYTIVYTSDSILMYVNGSLSDTFSVTLNTGTADSMRIGTDGLGNYFTGAISDMRMYEVALTQETITYMFSVGHNFEEKIPTNYVEESTRGVTISGSMLSRSSYGVKNSDEILSNSSYIYDENSDLQEAARTEYSQDSNGAAKVSIRVRHTENISNDNVLLSTVDSTPEKTTFTSANKVDDNLSSVIFSSAGVSVTSGKPGGIYFGANKDFRISIKDGESFLIEAFSSGVGDYITKMEVSK